jgi:diguanylate cyclase (GGDEF)-like protein
MESSAPGPERLLAIIELQNAIAAAGMNADDVMAIVADRAAMLTRATTTLVSLVDGEDLVSRAVSGPALALGSRTPKSAGLAGRAVGECRPLRMEDPPAVCVPLVYGEIAVGVLEVTGPRAFSDEDVETLRMLGQIIAIALHRAYTYPRPRPDVLQDALTGLGNRRAFDERIEAELNRNKRFGHSFSLALLELERFESAIDRVGQAAGDELLKRIASILKQQTRMIDGCFRIGAAEIALVMPGTSLGGARIVCDRSRTNILEVIGDSAVVPIFGVVEAMDESADSLANRAKQALAQR